jgi:hypothetical protein
MAPVLALNTNPTPAAGAAATVELLFSGLAGTVWRYGP